MTAPVAAAIFGLSGLVLTAEEKRFFRDANPFGFTLFARNVDTPAQVRALTASLRDAVGRDVPIFTDQEGGRVQRLRPPHWRDWLPALDMVDRALSTSGVEGAARAVRARYRIIAAELSGIGIDGNFAPCLDIAAEDTHPVLRNRCLGRDPDLVAVLGRAAAEGTMAGGVLPVVKHMPGHGRATADSHATLPRVAASRAELERTDFAPFRALADLPFAMTAHVTYLDIDPDGPATTSPTMIGLLRDRIGFHGLLMTDDLSMDALAGSPSSRAEAARAAGCDLILHCNGTLPEMAEVLAAAGAQSKVVQRPAPVPVDIAALEAELDAALSGRANV